MEKEDIERVVLCDTNVLIEFLKGDPKTIHKINKIGFENIAISSITLQELYIGSLNNKELGQIKSAFTGSRIYHVNEEISRLSLELIEHYSKSHNLAIPDAIIAATAIAHNLPLLTYNLKDFRYIKQLKLFQR